MDEEEVKKLATLCRIELSPEEISAYVKDFESILSYISDIEKVTEGASTKDSYSPLRNIMRDDGPAHKSGEFSDALMDAMPGTEKGYLKVKKILQQ